MEGEDGRLMAYRAHRTALPLVWLVTVAAGLQPSIGRAATTHTYNVGAAGQSVDIVSVSPVAFGFRVVLAAGAVLDRVFANDRLVDEAAAPKAWKVSQVDASGLAVVVVDSEGNGGAPSSAGLSTATLGRWFSSLSAWESARQGDLVARDAVEEAACFADAPLDDQLTLSGWVTDATRYIRIFTPSSERHHGTWPSGFRIEPSGAGNAITIDEGNFVRVEGLAVTASGLQSAGIRILPLTVVPGEARIAGNLVRCTSGQTRWGIAVGNITASRIWNNTVFGCDHVQTGPPNDYEGIGIDAAPSTNHFVYNNTVARSRYGFLSGGTSVARNNISVANAFNWMGTWDAASSHNVSSTTDAPGTSAMSSVLPEDLFVSLGPGAENLHLRPGSPAIDQGRSLSGDPGLAFTDDADGNARPIGAAWDIGADEDEPGGAAVKVYTIGVRSTGVDMVAVSGSGPWTVQLAPVDLSATAVNDRLLDETSDAWKVTQVDDAADTVTVVDSEGNGGAPAVGGTPASLGRWFATPAAWEAARRGDLIGRNAIEKGELYDDGPFTDPVIIYGSVTDEHRFMWLTVAPGHRHRGVAGTGVRFAPSAPGRVIAGHDPFTRIDWVDVGGAISATVGDGVIELRGPDVRVSNVLVHDFQTGPVMAIEGILRYGAEATHGLVTDSIVYNGATDGLASVAGVSAYNASTPLRVYNVTVANIEGAGMGPAFGGTLLAKNCISVGNTPDYDLASGGAFHAASTSNLSSDASAPGQRPLLGQSAAPLFVSLAPATEDLHLLPDAPVLLAGDNLSSELISLDIDGLLRPPAAAPAWDLGADQVSIFVPPPDGGTGTGPPGGPGPGSLRLGVGCACSAGGGPLGVALLLWMLRLRRARNRQGHIGTPPDAA